MNTDKKSITRPRCDKCGEVFMVIGTTAIRLAFPRPVTHNALMQEDTGICPKHPKGLVNLAISNVESQQEKPCNSL